jgi:two-component system alkaline phosphatase synthesis response regulator PhoP
MKKIFYVEDDKSIALIIEKTLENASFEAKGFKDGKTFFEVLENELPDLVLLDVMLPDMSGFDILKKLRQAPKTEDIPIIILSALTSEMDKVTGLDLGADDYMTKPFSVLELLSRINAKLKKHAKHDIIQLGNLTMDLAQRLVFVDNNEVTFTYKEFEILMLLMKRPNEAISREKMLNHVWNSDFVLESRTIDMHIKSMRRKLTESKASPEILTVRSVGYRIVNA